MKTGRWRVKEPSDGMGGSATVNYFKFPLGCRRDGESTVGSARGLGRDLVTVGVMVDCLEKKFGRDVIATTIADSYILVAIRTHRGDALFSGPSLWEAVQRTSEELDANVATGEPKPYGVALHDDTLVPFLKQISKSCRTGEVPSPILADDAGEHPMPVLDPQCFDQPEPLKSRVLSGTFRVTGICVGKDGTISLKLDHDSLWVQVEPAVERLASTWTLTIVRDGVWIDGKAIRLTSGIWQLQAGAKVVTHPALLADEEAVAEASK